MVDCEAFTDRVLTAFLVRRSGTERPQNNRAPLRCNLTVGGGGVLRVGLAAAIGSVCRPGLGGCAFPTLP